MRRILLSVVLILFMSFSKASNDVRFSMVSTDSYLAATSNILVGRVEKIHYVSGSEDQCSFVQYEVSILDEFRGDIASKKIPVVMIGLSSQIIREGDEQLLFVKEINDVKNDVCLSRSSYFSNNIGLFRVVNREGGMFVLERGYFKRSDEPIYSIKCSSDYDFLFNDFIYKGLLKLEAFELDGNECVRAKATLDSILSLVPSFPEFLDSDINVNDILNMDANCGNGSCTFNFETNDHFIDALDIDDRWKGNQYVPFSTPREINHQWAEGPYEIL